MTNVTNKTRTKPTLLITSCVHVSAPFVKLTNSTHRARLTIESLKQWLEIAGDLQIVICDGSGYDFSKECQEYFPNANIECLNFINNKTLVKRYGKGYGEGEIVEYALEHSKYLDQNDYFAKCTSKLWVRNFHEVLTYYNHSFQCNFAFEKKRSIRNIRPTWVDTRFYIIQKDFYLRNFKDAYKNVRDIDGYFLEHSFKDALILQERHIYPYIFPRQALIEGVSGSSAESFQISRCQCKNRINYIITRLIVKTNEFFLKPTQQRP